MKKLMKKKVNVFGKTFSLFAIVMVAAIGLTSAALVGYLSNNVSADTTIESPFLIEMATVAGDVLGDFSKSDTTLLGLGYGGSTFETRARITNQLDRDVGDENRNEAEIVITISATGDIVAGEITDIRIKDLYPTVISNEANEEWQALDVDDITGAIDASSGDIIIKVPIFFKALETSEYPIEMTVALNAEPTTYTVKIGVGMIGMDNPYNN